MERITYFLLCYIAIAIITFVLLRKFVLKRVYVLDNERDYLYEEEVYMLLGASLCFPVTILPVILQVIINRLL